MLNKLLQKSGGGFTLMEVLVAIFLILVGVVGAMTLVDRTITLSQVTSSKLVAAYLVQEGIEIVRNIRDSNWLSQPPLPWNYGLAEGDWEADYDDTALTNYLNRFLRINADGFYHYGLGTQTKFTRKITISEPATTVCPAGNCLKVSVQVQWKEKGKSNQIVVQENLYKWR